MAARRRSPGTPRIEHAVEHDSRRGPAWPGTRRRTAAARGRGGPSTKGMPIGSISALPAPNVAAEMALCARFCMWIGAIAGERRQRHAGQRHAGERADQRGVRGDPEGDDELHADDRADHAKGGDRGGGANSSKKRGWMREPGRGAVVGRSALSSSNCVPPQMLGSRGCGLFASPPPPAPLPQGEREEFGVIRPLYWRLVSTRSRVLRLQATRCPLPRPLHRDLGGSRVRITEAGASANRTSTIWSVRVNVTSSPVPRIVRHVAVGVEHHATHTAARQTAVQTLLGDADALGYSTPMSAVRRRAACEGACARRSRRDVRPVRRNR